MRKLFALLAVAAVVLAIAPAVQAQSFAPLFTDKVNSVSSAVTAVDTAPVMLVKYIGSTTQASTFAVTTFDYIFTVGGSADTTISGCGASAGTLDTNNASCNTLVELVNKINASANWLAIPLGGLGTDSVDTGGAASAVDVTATAGSAAKGVVTYHDTSDELNVTVTFYPSNTPDIRDFSQSNYPSNPFLGYYSVLTYYVQNFTGSAATGYVYAVTDSWSGTRTAAVWSQSVRTLYSFTGASTGVDKALNDNGFPIVFTNPGERLVIRGAAGSTLTSPRVTAFGFLVHR